MTRTARNTEGHHELAHPGAGGTALDDLASLPPAFLIVGENDVLRDVGEAYARRLIEAGVPTTGVRYNNTLHDFMMLNPVRDAHAARAATAQAIAVLKTALHTGKART
ncbi:alpha/beta hydrolase fold domain-containing protein [Actinomadura sp. 6N118]|uniref:alpha/beta hydrolase fold domain-containing protein n=1 Tax=Actinomadura sp. 6N118 TaxID=3375151 RepID=UPI00378FC9B3